MSGSEETQAIIDLARSYGDENWTFELREGIADLIQAAKLEAYQEAAKVAENYRENQSFWMSSEWKVAKEASELAGASISHYIRKLGEAK